MVQGLYDQGEWDVFDLDQLIAEFQRAALEASPHAAVRDVLERTLSSPSDAANALGRDAAGIEILHHAADLTVLNVVWAPHMSIFPHDHRMWAVIGIYGGAEDNQLYRRASGGITPSRTRRLEVGDTFVLGSDAVHAVNNPLPRFTGAIHVYGGDFVNQPRSQWSAGAQVEAPYDGADVRRVFEEANAAWARLQPT